MRRARREYQSVFLIQSLTILYFTRGRKSSNDEHVRQALSTPSQHPAVSDFATHRRNHPRAY